MSKVTDGEKDLLTISMPHVEGVDTMDGLQRINGKVDLYKRLLRQFAKEYANVADGVQLLINQGDKEAVRKLAHTIKGTAGMLGALNLHEAAGILEGSLISGDGKSEWFLDQFKGEIKRVTTSISEALPEDEPIRPDGMG